MTYSVWNGATKRYDYYEAPLDAYGQAPAPSLASGKTIAMTQAAWKLPGGAVRNGSGEVAKGMIASVNNMGLGTFDLGSSSGMLGLAVAAYLVYKYTR